MSERQYQGDAQVPVCEVCNKPGNPFLCDDHPDAVVALPSILDEDAEWRRTSELSVRIADDAAVEASIKRISRDHGELIKALADGPRPEMALSVYVAGASAERAERAQPVMKALVKGGYRVTHDWTEACDMHGANNEHGTLSAEDLAACAYADLCGVRCADIFVLLAPERPSTGAWAELGIALLSGCRILIVGKCEQCIFTWLPQCRKFDTDGDLVRFLTEAA